MAPIKFEEHIKDKLEKRTVVPSSEAWSKLSHHLTAEEKRNKKSAFWWFGIAASIAALVFVSITYFNTENEPSTAPKLVEENVQDLLKTPLKNPTKTEVAVEVTKLDSNTDAILEIKQNQLQIITPKKLPIMPTESFKREVAVAEVSKPNIKETKPNTIITEMIESPTEIKFNSVIAEINIIKATNNTVTDQQIDSLLKAANKELLRSKIFKNGTNVVDADALLQDVEEDMGQSFRTKVYEALKGGYKKVKTVVAERNN